MSIVIGSAWDEMVHTSYKIYHCVIGIDHQNDQTKLNHSHPHQTLYLTLFPTLYLSLPPFSLSFSHHGHIHTWRVVYQSPSRSARRKWWHCLSRKSGGLWEIGEGCVCLELYGQAQSLHLFLFAVHQFALKCTVSPDLLGQTSTNVSRILFVPFYTVSVFDQLRSSITID